MIKIIATPEDIVKWVLEDFENGFTNSYGEPESSFYCFAEDDEDGDIYASVQVIKEKYGLENSEWFYSILLCDYINIDESAIDSYELYSTNSLDINELKCVIQNIINIFDIK